MLNRNSSAVGALLLFCLAYSPFVSIAEESDEKNEKSKLVAIHRFYDKKLHEHVYSYGEGEPAAWRLDSDKEGETIIGYASTVELPGTQRLWRAVRPDGKHYFYFQAKPKAKDLRLEEFVIYVWKNKGDGRIPIHGCSLPDSTDMLLEQDMKKVKKFIDGTQAGIGVKRNAFPNAFYLYSKPKVEKSKDDKPKNNP